VTAAAEHRLWVGILVGGAAKRMGGVPKGMLKTAGGETVVDRLSNTVRAAFPRANIVLVGSAAGYQSCPLPRLEDDPPGIGPLGGLAALLEAAAAEGADAIALAGDMPHVTTALLARLVAESAGADAVAPRPEGIWQPLCAWYRAAPALTVARLTISRGDRALHAVLDALGEGARALPLEDSDALTLRDWDTPDAVRGDGGAL
jgi:molybdopterin-guanine dinucleotide biosynthesis protein A